MRVIIRGVCAVRLLNVRLLNVRAFLPMSVAKEVRRSGRGKMTCRVAMVQARAWGEPLIVH